MSETTVKTASVEDIADAMRRDFQPSHVNTALGRTILLVGAGCSVSAGIPLASDIAKELVQRLAVRYSATSNEMEKPLDALVALIKKQKFPSYLIENTQNDEIKVDWASVYDYIFTNHYKTPKETRAIFSEILNRSERKINWAHLCLGELVRIGFVSTVLTTNFDQLALEGIARTGRIPVVADGIESLYRITGDANYPQLIQIHGSRHTYYLRNSKEDTDLLAHDAGARHAIDELLRAANVFLVVGYGGREQGLMQLLNEAGRRWPDTQIFWVTYSQDGSDLGKYVKSLLLTSRHAAAVFGQDADDFFLKLLELLGCVAPKIIDDPLYLVRDLRENLIYSKNKTIEDLIDKHKHKVNEIQALSSFEGSSTSNNAGESNKEEPFQAQKMQVIGQLAGGIAHDFNNILQAIIGYSDLLLANHRTNDPAFADIMQIKQNANRGASLVRQLLAFARRQTLNPETADVNATISDLFLLLKRLIGEGIELRLDLTEKVWPVKIDINQFEQVIVNLAVNARDAMPAGGSLLMRTANVVGNIKKIINGPEIEYVLIEVTDSGEGIRPEIMGKIFEPFFTTKEAGKGTGLGLSTVFGIINQSGGTVEVRSKINKGTSFIIKLPRSAEDFGAKNTSIGEIHHDENSNGKNLLSSTSATILLVEDEDPVRQVNARALTHRGFKVVEAQSGYDALDIIKSRSIPFDLIISNVVMPKMSGPTFVNEVWRQNPSQKVIFVSGYAEDAFRKNLILGNFTFLPKPFTLKQLIDTVREELLIEKNNQAQ